MSTACPQTAGGTVLGVSESDILLRTLLGVTGDVQVCFCGPDSAGLPDEPLTDHSLGCLIWDWALAVKKITPEQRLEQVKEYDRQLGRSSGN